MEFNEDLVDPVRPTVSFIQITVIISSVILEIACYKWRFMADLIIYLILISSLNIYMIPSIKT